jgi:hypothetical protein
MRLLSDERKLLSQYVLLSAEERGTILRQAIRDQGVSGALIRAYKAVDEVL